MVGPANHAVLIRKEGREFHIDDSAASILGVNARMIRIVLVFRDIRERHASEVANGQRDTKSGSTFSRLMRTAVADGSQVLLENSFGKPKSDPGSRTLVGDVRLEQAFADGWMDSMSVV